MAQPVGAERGHARPDRSTADDPADVLAGQRPGRREHRGEHLAEPGGRAAVPQPVRDRGADIGRQRQDVVLAALAADPGLAGPPVKVVQAEPCGFPGPQPEPGQQQDDGVVPLAGRLVPVAGGQQRPDLPGLQPPGQHRDPPAGHGQGRGGHVRADQSPHVAVPQERAQRAREVLAGAGRPAGRLRDDRRRDIARRDHGRIPARGIAGQEPGRLR
jgi:hypothetical protein